MICQVCGGIIREGFIEEETPVNEETGKGRKMKGEQERKDRATV